MNGSRLKEHRKPRVSPESWWLLGIVVVAMLALVQWQAEAQYEPFVKDTGIVHAGAEMCYAPDLGAPSIKLLNTWQGLVYQLEDYQRGGSPMHEEDAILGQQLYDNDMCHTMAATYHIFIVQDTEGYVLARFDEQHEFDTRPFIVSKQDVLLDRGI